MSKLIFFSSTDHLAFTIEATDAEDDTLSYSLRESSAFFRVDGSTGKVYVKAHLDREVQCRG